MIIKKVRVNEKQYCKKNENKGIDCRFQLKYDNQCLYFIASFRVKSKLTHYFLHMLLDNH